MKKRFLSLALAVLMIFSLFPLTASAADIVSSGSLGDNLTWTLDSDGLLTISGSGAMMDFHSNSGFGSVSPFSQNTAIKSVVIESGATTIGNHVFDRCGSLESVDIPDSITGIGRYAFSECISLKSIAVPDSVTSFGSSAFYNCSSLTSIEIPDSVMSIGDSAFSGCSSLTNVEIPDSITSIESSLFSGCSSLITITIPDSISSIGSSAFSSCSSLTNVEIPDSVKTIDSYAFYGCSSLASVSLPAGITSISSRVFQNCTSLTEMTIPDNITSIGSYAFFGCTGLTEITFPSGLREIDDYAFSGCTGLTSITIPSSLYSNGLYSHAFSNCTSLTEVHGLESRSVPNDCFSGCIALTAITVGSAGSNAFSGCKSLKQAEIRGIVGSYAFKDCSSLQQAAVGGDIAEYAFNGCEALTRLTMTGGSTIGTYAVANCPALTTVALPTSLTTVEGNAFRNDTALTDVHYSGTQEQWNAIAIRTSGNAPLLNASIHTDCQHTETELRNFREATCTESGYTGDVICTLCGVTVQRGSTVSALGHDWGEWITTEEPTGTEEGQQTHTCVVCGETETRMIPIPGSPSQVSVTPTTDNPSVNVTINVGDTLTINVTNGSAQSQIYEFTATNSNNSVASITKSSTGTISGGASDTITAKGLAVGTTDITISNNNQYGDQYSRKAVIHLTVVSGGTTPTTEPTTQPGTTTNKMGIDTNEVVDGMNTKWNALGFRPGLVGGHCIGVDPYYFVYEAERLGHHSQIILNGRIVNDSMGEFVANKAIQKMIEAGQAPKKSKVVVLGLTFKENCPDCRNSKVADILDRMREFGIEPEVVDPWADPEVAKREYNVELKDLNEVHGADCVIVAVAHREFRKLGLAGIERLYREDAKRVLLDVKGIYQIKDLEDASFVWWRL